MWWARWCCPPRAPAPPPRKGRQPPRRRSLAAEGGLRGLPPSLRHGPAAYGRLTSAILLCHLPLLMPADLQEALVEDQGAAQGELAAGSGPASAQACRAGEGTHPAVARHSDCSWRRRAWGLLTTSSPWAGGGRGHGAGRGGGPGGLFNASLSTDAPGGARRRGPAGRAGPASR